MTEAASAPSDLNQILTAQQIAAIMAGGHNIDDRFMCGFDFARLLLDTCPVPGRLVDMMVLDANFFIADNVGCQMYK